MGDNQGFMYESKIIFIILIISCVTACNFVIIFGCIYAITPYDDQYNFFSKIGWSIASKFREMKCETAFDLTKKFDWSGKKYLFTVMENVVQFLHSIHGEIFLGKFSIQI